MSFQITQPMPTHIALLIASASTHGRAEEYRRPGARAGAFCIRRGRAMPPDNTGSRLNADMAVPSDPPHIAYTTRVNDLVVSMLQL